METTEKAARILIVDDERAVLKGLESLLRREKYVVTALDSPVVAIQTIVREDFDVALLDIRMPELSGLELLEAVKRTRPEIEVIMMTGFATVETAISAVKAGAYDYLTKPFEDLGPLLRGVAKALERKRLADRNRHLEKRLAEQEGALRGVLDGNSRPVLEVARKVEAVACSTATVLLQGESGTGKEVVARALHARSPRRERPFVALNCGALTDTLLESELFGHLKGAFSGAVRDQRGLFEAADGGTIFLDEIGDVSPATQVRLLRVLQEGEIRRVGSTQPLQVDVRVIAATHQDLPKMVKDGRFREDLYYRLNVITIALPALREHLEDVPLLAIGFLRHSAEQLGREVRAFSPEAMQALCQYHWPGNVRELENAVEHAVVLCQGNVIGPADLPALARSAPSPKVVPLHGHAAPEWTECSYAEAKDLALHQFEKTYLESVMSSCDGNISAAARRASMDRSNFKRLLRKHGGELEANACDDDADEARVNESA